MDLLQKCDPSSLMMVVLNLVKMFFFKNLITALASLIVNACAFTHFKTYSIATNMYKLLLDDTMILGSLYLLAKLHSHRSQTSLPMIGIWITAPLYGAMCPSHFGVANHCIMHPIHARALEKRHNAPHASKSSTSRNPCNNIFCLLDILLHLKKWPQYSHE